MQGDALSDNVNLTSRVEGLTKIYDVSLIITESTYAGLENPNSYCIRFLDRVRVRGKSQTLDLYEVFDADPPEQRQLKIQCRDEYDLALKQFYERDFEAAQASLFSILKQKSQGQGGMASSRARDKLPGKRGAGGLDRCHRDAE